MMENKTELVEEICAYIFEHGQYPPRGYLSKTGKDLGKALTRFRTGEVRLEKQQIELLAAADEFLSRTEKNIQELEQFYHEHGHLPLGEENIRFREIMGSYKSGKVPITKEQQARLENIGVLLDSTERMIRAIEAYCEKNHKAPGKGKKSPEGYDMGSALIGYRTGRRKLTLAQKRRLEAKGISLPNAVIKEEKQIAVRVIPKKETLADQIQKLKQERETLVSSSIQKEITQDKMI